jgi:type I restriction-modification system DNA methylase subunit
MSATYGPDWWGDFGLDSTASKTFFSDKADLNAETEARQSHIMRRAFDLLKLDGILCAENVPLVYFKTLKRINAAEVADLHRKFWNHGGAPILALITSDEVHVYSGFTKPNANVSQDGSVAGLVGVIERASEALRQFLPSVESGQFFRVHEKSFQPSGRVDRDLLDNLQATRESLIAKADVLESKDLDALLCRLVFACYLFDREIVGETYLESIGLTGAAHLRDVLGVQPKTKAKKVLYDLFRQLGKDFNGDLFSDDLDSEAAMVSASHIVTLAHFFHATNVRTGQGSFWPYDFSAIPIEAISAIYERFLTDKSEGAFYTPRFLAELVLDLALSREPSLLDKRYFDPACGSGIFLVGLFIRMAEQWKRNNPDAINDCRARELRKLLCENLAGVDKNPTACRITAFSLYLAYLDQLSPRDIQELKEKGHRLPTLVHYSDRLRASPVEGKIWCGDFFDTNAQYPVDADLVIGNPPWGSTALPGTAAAKWCSERGYIVPDKQIATTFVWKAAHHVRDHGKICLVLPHGTLFNLSKTALEFQRSLLKRHALDHVLNLADYQRFLFEEAGHPALVIYYRKEPPETPRHGVQYWAPKADWLVTRAEIITVLPEDRSTVSVEEILRDLEGPDAPQIWKQRYWATPRDWRLIDRLSMYPRIRGLVRRAKEKQSDKPWFMAVGFQPVTENDDPNKAEIVTLPSNLFIGATSKNLDLFLLEDECKKLPAAEVAMRSGSNKATAVYKAPHVLVPKGFTSTAYADFDVAFQDAIRAISGPTKDRDLLIFLAAYLRSPLARYFLFHTSSNWGVSRQQVHVAELTRLPFPLPEHTVNPNRSREIVKEIARIVLAASKEAGHEFVDRRQIVRGAEHTIEPLINEYFDVAELEQKLVDDTVDVIIPSVRPTRQRRTIPTIEPSKPKHREAYVKRLCDTLNNWGKNSSFIVQGRPAGSMKLGVGITVLQKTSRGENAPTPAPIGDLLEPLYRLRNATAQRLNTFELMRGAKVFEKNRLYIVKPIGRRFWTETAALNDADEIAGTILMHQPKRSDWQ